MNELPLLLLILAPVVLILIVIARASTHNADTKEETESMGYRRRKAYFMETIGEEAGDMFKSAYKFIRNLLR